MLDIETESEIENKNNDARELISIGVNCQLTLLDIKRLTSSSSIVKLSSDSYPKLERSYQFLKSQIDCHLPVYGINTNFGDQINFLDPYLNTDNDESYNQSINNRQSNIIKSLACSLGEIVSPEIVKATMMLRAHCLAQGYSGVTPILIDAMLKYLNAGIVPLVRRYGSIGASGDLIPLATIAAAMIGENVDVTYNGKLMRAPEAIAKAGLTPLIPQLRDGLALINGTSFMTGIASLALYDLKRLFKQMLSAIAMSLEAMQVISSAYHPLVHQLKRQKGECIVNDFLLNFWQGSQLISDLDELRINKKTNSSKPSRSVQDYYSVRSVAQGFGSMNENLAQATIWIENEMNSVNDNPIIDAANKEIHHGANFMGYYVTDACDMLKINIAQASTWIHALLANMLHPRKNHGLPANLVENPETNNGFRSFQLLAAALAVQNRKLAQSQQSFMLPTEGDNQDVNSLGTHAALDFQEAVANLERLTAILLLVSLQALGLRGIYRAGIKSQRIYQAVRKSVLDLTICRIMQKDINEVIGILKTEGI